MKPVHWIGSSKEDLQSFPKEARREVGLALDKAQRGGKHLAAKPLQGFGGSSVLEIVENHNGDTYRAVYTVRFPEAIFVLHCFKKKSKSGIKTPKMEIELIESRLKQAKEAYEQWLKQRNK